MLFTADRSVLVVVDVQPYFVGKLPDDVGTTLVQRVAWLAAVAVALDVPVVVTEEEPGRNGATVDAVRERLPGVTAHTKPTFGLANTPSILDAVTRTGRDRVVLCGLETDVCVAQSAIGLADLGWPVGVVRDACGAPGEAHDQGLERMAAEGVRLVGLKGLYYEWIRSVDRLGLAGLPADRPVGIVM